MAAQRGARRNPAAEQSLRHRISEAVEDFAAHLLAEALLDPGDEIILLTKTQEHG